MNRAPGPASAIGLVLALAAYLAGPASSRARRYSSLRAYWRWSEGLAPGPFPLAAIPHPGVDLPLPRALLEEARLAWLRPSGGCRSRGGPRSPWSWRPGFGPVR